MITANANATRRIAQLKAQSAGRLKATTTYKNQIGKEIASLKTALANATKKSTTTTKK